MSPPSPFDTRSAVADAYGTLPAGLERVVAPIAIWSAVGFVVVPGASFLLLLVPTGWLWAAAPLLYVAAYTETVVLLAASLSITIAWHRWIILGEEKAPLFPDRNVATPYLLPFASFFFVPFIILPYALDALLAALDRTVDSLAYDIATYGGTALVAAGASRYSLVLAARATGDGLSLRESWSLTAGSAWPLFWGMLACRLPFAGVAIWLDEMTTTFASGSLGNVAFYYFGSLSEVITDAVTSAFVAFAYLHFTRDRPSAHDIARHFA